MAYQVANKHQTQLSRIKDSVRNAHDYFRHNYDSYNEFKKFVFESSLTNDELTLLETIGRPQIEFNVLEAYVSRLLGEFSKQEPDIEVSADDQSKSDPLTIKIVQQHLRHVMLDNSNEHTKYEVYKDLLSGGFSCLKVFTDYANPMSMDQVIKIERVFDPTLCGFDSVTKTSHKGDGRFCFELFPMQAEDFEVEYPDIQISTVNFRRDFAGFNWSYLNNSEKIIVMCEYYEKKKKEEMIVQVRDGRVMTKKKYEEMLETWDDITVPPVTIGKPRKTTIETIHRYKLIENQIISHEETDFGMLPLIFVDGNSVQLKTNVNGNVRQVTRPYVYHAKGAQRLKNFSGIALANEIENTVQHKFMVAKEALPKEEEFLEAYKNVQQANVLVFNSVHESNPEMPIQNPVREVNRIPAPPEIAQAFTGTDSLIQNVLGSYDASLGINNNQLSGIAIVEAASQSNATAMPYIVGYLQGFQRAAQLYVDLMPKYYTTPRTIPILDEDGQRNYIKVNQEDGLPMDFDTNILNVTLKAGASFQVQKSRTIMMVKEMMGMSPLFAQFIAEKGLNFVLDNMEGKGIEELKKLTEEWVMQYQQDKQQAQQAQQQEQQQNPAMMKMQVDMAKLEHEKQKDSIQFQIDLAQLKLDEQKILAEMVMQKEAVHVQQVKAATELAVHHAQHELDKHDMGFKHLKESVELHHKGLETKHKISQIKETKHE